MPVIQTFDPLSAAVDLAAGYFTQKRQNQNDASDRDFVHQQADRAQSNEDRSFGLQKQSVESELQTAAQQRKIQQAEADWSAQTRPIQMKIMQLQAQGLGHSNQAQQLANQLTQIQIGLQKKYGDQEAQLGILQAQVSINSTSAGTDATRVGTAHAEAMWPYDLHAAQTGVQQGDENLRTSRLQNQGLTQQLNLPTGAPPTTAEEQEYRLRHATWQKAGSDPNSEPVSPMDLRANVEATISAIQSGQTTVQKAMAGMGHDPRLSPSQRSLAMLMLKQALGGGSQVPARPQFPGP